MDRHDEQETPPPLNKRSNHLSWAARMATQARRLTALRLRSIRRRELEKVLRKYPIQPHARTLEIGSADGYQAGLLSTHTTHLFTTDIYRDEAASSPRFHVAFPEHLPLRSNTLDLVFSSCVMEHVSDRNQVVQEIFRILKPGGLMIHIVPGPAWKVLSLLEHYAYLPAYLVNVLSTRGGDVVHPLARHEKGSIWRVLAKYLVPQVHGNYRDHRHEWTEYQVKSWERLFANHGFAVENTLPLYVYGYLTVPLIPAPQTLGRKGFAGTIAFVCRKSSSSR